MRKSRAKALAYEGKMTYNQLQELISKCDRTGPSKINTSMTKEQVLVLLQASIKDENPKEVPVTTWYNHRDKLTLTGHGMIVMNILTECGED
jgi:hypothetical protein